MLSTNQIAEFVKLSYLKNYLKYNVHFLHVIRYPWKLKLNHVIFVGFGQACLGIHNFLQSNKASVSLRSYFVYLSCM